MMEIVWDQRKGLTEFVVRDYFGGAAGEVL